jgi:alpha-mannosidase
LSEPRDVEPLNGWEFKHFKYTRQRERIEIDNEWRPISVGERWGGPDMSAKFRCSGRMPARFKGKTVVLKVYFSGDTLLYVNGKPYHGIDPFRDTVFLTNAANGDESYEFEAESYIMWHFGEDEIKTLEISQLAVMDVEMKDIYWDFRAAYNVMMVPNQDPDLVEFLKAGFIKAIEPIDQNEKDLDLRRANARKARDILRREIYETDRFQKEGLIHLAGNSHLDVVFLWTHAEFVRKLGRTHATALRLLAQYPEYTFSQSQPLMYEEMKNNYPEMYEEVKQMVKAKRWEVIGAFWVEPDCNLISGESFTRQILYGIDFVEREFGVTPRTCWCPDVFGNAWTMPQILAKSGLKYFVTHKMGVWNDTNPWRKNTFWWQGPDGSRIFSLMPPTHFIGSIEADHLAEHWKNFGDKKTIGESLYNFGWGDGGGGPDVEMLEYQRRYANFPGVVPTKPSFVEEALDRMYEKGKDADLPVWNDELYLEEHRGVHTTKARLKKLNRICENLYRNAELFSVLSGRVYPRETLEQGWKIVLTNQFHDSLPGSHISPVYQDLLEAYDKTLAIGTEVLGQSRAAIVRRVHTSGEGRALVVFNSQPFIRNTIASVEMEPASVHVVDSEGREVPCQFIKHYETGRSVMLFEADGIPAVGYKVFRLIQGKGKTSFKPVSVSQTSLENDLVRVTLNGEGEIVSLIDKQTGHECIDAGKRGNVLKLYEDVPGNYEAWDIAPTYTKVTFDVSGATVEVLENGPIRSAIQVSRSFRGSKMTQRIVLTRTSARVDFETWVDWHEQQKLLKVRFFTNIVTRLATYDIPYGNIQRSSYRNNSFDEAKFEVSAHYWMDLSQHDYGLSLLNNCKYGHEAFDGMMSLSLLRGPLSPDPLSDQEEHWFTYSLYPHNGNWTEGGTQQQALDLNDPVGVVVCEGHKGELPPVHGFISVDAPNVTLEALKQAEKSHDVVIRLLERYGATRPVTVTFDKALRTATECNLLEREDVPVKTNGKTLTFEIKPYEIRTFKVRFD